MAKFLTLDIIMRYCVFILVCVLLIRMHGAWDETSKKAVNLSDFPHHHHTDLASKTTNNFYSDLKNREWVLKVVNHCAAADEKLQVSHI